MAGPWVGIAAPGENITSVGNADGGGLANALPSDQGELFPLNSASFAAAYVSGVAALVRSRFPELTAEQVIDRLTAGAQGAARAPSNLTGAGLVDPVASLTWDVSAGERRLDGEPEPKPVAAPPQPAPPDTTPRTVAFVGTGSPGVDRRHHGGNRHAHRRNRHWTEHRDHPNCAGVAVHRSAAMAYPWESDTDWWILGIAIGVVGRIRLVARTVRDEHDRSAVGDLAPQPFQAEGADIERRHLVLHVDDPAGVGLSLPLVAGYVERFGVRCEKVRVTNRDERGARTTWVSMTLSATDNLAALRARSAELPLFDTAEIVGRRLADHLRETGLSAGHRRRCPGTTCRRRPREVARGSSETTGSYRHTRIPVDERPRRASRRGVVAADGDLDRARIQRHLSTSHDQSALCAVRTAEAVRGAPVAGLTAAPGHSAAVAHRVGSGFGGPSGHPESVRCRRDSWSRPGGWWVGAGSVEHEVAHEASHPA